MKYPFLIHNRVVFRTAAGTAGSYVTRRFHEKMDVKICLMFIVSENTGSVNISKILTAFSRLVSDVYMSENWKIFYA